ncbi:DUF4232 domain-containing protein [Streptomyces sp. NRRL F-5126]|uniref:DUF4232 domain-containing protein n=1 Tax=Streptomyces sp. NRRL F-5126 TaxID=1463857 RepID=UPI0004CAF8EE|nr:DUF4232 domain-containing protein [Streptomyces sp. NRRL F-5126]
MNVKKMSALALVAVAASFSLTACGGSDSGGSDSGGSAGAAAGASPGDGGTPLGAPSDGSGSASAPASGSGGSASGSNAAAGSGKDTGSGTGGGTGSTSGSACKTANLAFTTSGGMAEGELLVNLKNTGATACAMHGFPGVDLKSQYGTEHATRSAMSVPTVKLAAGQETHFTLHYPPNHTGGSGVTFTKLIITPPNETHSHTVPTGINIPVSDSSSGPGITVDPVGAGK